MNFAAADFTTPAFFLASTSRMPADVNDAWIRYLGMEAPLVDPEQRPDIYNYLETAQQRTVTPQFIGLRRRGVSPVCGRLARPSDRTDDRSAGWAAGCARAARQPERSAAGCPS